jgi:3-oxoacyl-[acyl-carrier protein] reductase
VFEPITSQPTEGELLVKGGGSQSMAFTFGDPAPVLDGREILDYLECWSNGRWYEPPVFQRFGTLHILVNNAALAPTGAADAVRRNKHYAYITTAQPRQSLGFTSEITDEEWHRYWDVNVHGMFYCTREALKLMQEQRYGRIVNLASIAGMSAISAHSPHYSASKGAVIAFTKSVAAEVAGGNILVNALAPGGVSTPFFEEYLDSIGEEGRRRFWQVIPAGRFGTTDEYASVATFLAGDHYFVGQVISPNGGAVL